MKLSDFDYELPEELIARYPLPRRDASRMMVINRATQTIEHRLFSEFTQFLPPETLLVLNDAKVIPTRLRTTSPPRGELMLLEAVTEKRWKCLGRPAKKMPKGAVVEVANTRALVVEEGELGERVVDFEEAPDLHAHGEMPIPPYLGRAAEDVDRERYQNVFASREGAVAAPTAGLHFTDEILAQVEHTFITLWVGAGTFRDIKVEKIEDHVMHAERYEVSGESVERIRSAKKVLSIGTTVSRVLESCAPRETLKAKSGWTDIFIHPPYQFQSVDHLLTNFHLPKSSLLLMISAFGGTDLIREGYRQAVRERYRFFSYGDCMLIL
ncbi:MAG: tRNA preQ1(34) S-adenosylmethionine ribosyltransferase-isomerase QueA [Verrucomicrobiales bacterium]